MTISARDSIRNFSDLSPDDLIALDQAHLVHPGTSPYQHSISGPIVMVSGHGSWVRDVHGREYIDGYAAMGSLLVGHGRTAIADAIAEQARTMAFSTSYYHYSNPRAIELATQLAALTPGDLNHVYFTMGGSESNESAFKLVRYYWGIQGKPERHKIISRHRSYHGLTIATMSATGLPQFQKWFGPLAPGFLQVATFDPDALEAAIQREGPDTVAAFIAEPVLGVGGHVPPPDDYFPRVREICDRYGVLLIADEVVTGFGRTGKLFGIENWGVTPDLMTFAKGLTSGYLPLGACVISDRIYQALVDNPGGPVLSHGFTYSGHAVCCAAGLANLRIVLGEDLPSQAAATGRYLLERLQTLARHELVGEVRGYGLMAAVELVKRRDPLEPFEVPGQAGNLVYQEALKHQVIIRPAGDTITIRPPLVLTRDEVDTIVAALDQAIATVQPQLLASR